MITHAILQPLISAMIWLIPMMLLVVLLMVGVWCSWSSCWALPLLLLLLLVGVPPPRLLLLLPCLCSSWLSWLLD